MKTLNTKANKYYIEDGTGKNIVATAVDVRAAIDEWAKRFGVTKKEAKDLNLKVTRISGGKAVIESNPKKGKKIESGKI